MNQITHIDREALAEITKKPNGPVWQIIHIDGIEIPTSSPEDAMRRLSLYGLSAETLDSILESFETARRIAMGQIQ